MKLSKKIKKEYGSKVLNILWAGYKADVKVYGKSFERFLVYNTNQLTTIAIRNAVNKGKKFVFKYE